MLYMISGLYFQKQLPLTRKSIRIAWNINAWHCSYKFLRQI